MNPNIVVILIDALRADRVGAVGGRELTPNIDELAVDSAVFTNAHTTINVTDPAVTSLQTGQYPLSHGIVNHGSRVTDNQKSAVEATIQLPEVLSNSGYRTAKFGRPLGRWHRNGFDIYPSSMEGRRAFDKTELGRQGSEEILQQISNSLERIHPQIETFATKAYQRFRSLSTRTPDKEELVENYRNNDDSVVDNFARFLNGSNPSYSFIHLMDTHSPYAANPERVVANLEKFEYQPDTRMRATGTHPQIFDTVVRSGQYPDIEDQFYLSDGRPTTAVTDAHYDATVSKADERVGAIIEILQEKGVYDDTLLVVLSDHGESLTEHGIYYDHHGLYDVTMRIPLIIRPPGGVNRESENLAQITDIAPTIEAYTNCHGLRADGESLRSVIEGDDTLDRPLIIAEEAHAQRRRMVSSGESKLVYSVNDETVCRYCGIQHARDTEFYDTVSDPGEKKNIEATREESVEKFRKYGDELAAMFVASRASSDDDVHYEDETEVQKRLEALGYR